MDHFGKITKAVQDLRTPRGDIRVGTLHHEMEKRIADLIHTSPKFYLPDARSFLAGRDITPDIQALVRLPFDSIVLLTECNWSEGLPGTTWVITLAFRMPSEVTRKLRIPDYMFADSEIGIISLIDGSHFGTTWAVFPAFGALKPGKELGYEIRAYPIAGMEEFHHTFEKATKQSTADELAPDVFAVVNLCVLLAMRNVKAVKVDAPAKLNKKRAAHGKPLFYDYHVLEIDGVKQTSLGRSSSGSRDGARSHLRRGHVRRLTADYHTWVRETYVHGRREGFVAKDYKVKGTLH